MKKSLLFLCLLLCSISQANNLNEIDNLNLSINIENAVAIKKEHCAPVITTGMVSASTICAGVLIDVPVSFTDCVDAGNVFTVELSDAVGSFASPVVIGSVASITPVNIAATIPANITFGTGYRMRVVASAPATIGSDNGVDLVLLPKPNASFSVNAVAQCITTNNYSFLNTSTGSIANYSWNYGDGNTATTVNGAHVYSAAGLYNLQLVAVGTNNCRDSVTQTMQVVSVPVANFSTAQSVYCAFNRVDFVNTTTNSIGAVTYSWSFGDGNTSSNVAPSNEYITDGVKNVKLIATTIGVCKDSITKVLTVLENFQATFVVNNATQCLQGNSFIFTNSTAGPITSSWNFGDGITSSLYSPVKVYTSAGNYTVSLTTANGNNSCKDTATQNITILQNPFAGFTFVGDTGCTTNRVINFSNTSTGVGNTYFWDFGDGTSSTANNPTHTYAAAGLYFIKLVVTSSNGCKDSVTQSINFNSNAIAAFTVNNLNQCVGTNNFIFNNTSTGGIVANSWSFGDGITSSILSPTHTYSTGGTFIVKLVITSAAGCKDSVTQSVNVNGLPVPNFTIIGATNCTNNLTLSFTNTSTGASNYNWSFGDGNTSSLTNPTYAYAVAGTYTIKLVATSANGCVDSTKQTVTFTTNPVASYTVNNTSQCVNNNSFVLINTSTNGTTYNWNFGDGGSSTLANPTKTYLVAGTYTVKLVVTNAAGCKDSTTQTVTVLPRPTASFTTSGVTSCTNNLTLSFTNTSTGASNYNWSFGDGNTSSLTNPTYAYAVVGTYTIKLVATSANGCVDSTKQAVTFTTNPVASYTVNSLSCTNNLSVQINNTSSSAVTYNWSFGDGSFSTLANPIKTYMIAGTYSIKLVVTGANGCKDSLVKSITVSIQPKSSFTIPTVAGCKLTDPILFTNTSLNAVNYLWKFGDGVTSTSIHPTHVYSTIGSYFVTLYAFGVSGCVDSFTQAVIFRPKPVATFIALPSSQCNNAFNFVDNSIITSLPATYNWIFGDGNFSFLQNPTNAYLNAGTYNVTLVVTNQNGCKDSAFKTITVDPKPVANFTMPSTSICTNSTAISFTNLSVNAVNYVWKFGDGDTSVAANPTHIYSSVGTYLVKLFAINANGCKDSFTQTITVLSKPVSSFTFNSNTICTNQQVDFINSSTPTNNIFYKWSFGDGNTSTLQNPRHSYATAGSYLVRLIVFNTNACSDTTSVLINVIKSPVSSFIYTGSTNCTNNLTLAFTSTSVNAVSYAWSFGDGHTTTLVNPTNTFSSVGAYTVKLVVLNTNGCTDSSMQTIQFTTKPVSLFAINTVSQCLRGNLYSFTNKSTNAIHYLWNFGDGSIDTSSNPNHTYTKAGVYNVQLIVTNISGCRDTATESVSVLPTAQAAFNVVHSSLCSGNNIIAFENESINSNNYTWYFGDGNLSTQTNPSNPYSAFGTYTVKLISYNSNGCNDTSTKTINVVPSPTASFSVNDSNQCINVNYFQFINNSTNAQDYVWNFGDGTYLNASLASKSYITSGIYIVNLTATNINGCSASFTKTITVLPKPIAAFNLNNFNSCIDGYTVSFINTTIGASNYYWSFGDGIMSNSFNPIHLYTSSGKYTVMLIATTASGCSDTVYQDVTIVNKPTSVFTITSSSSQCLNANSFSFVNTSTLGTTYSWNFGDGTTSADLNPTKVYTLAGDFTISLKVTSADGCTSTSLRTISVLPTPVAAFSLNNFNPCLGGLTVNIINNSTGGVNYIWNFGDASTSTLADPTKIYSSYGNYAISLIATSISGCNDTVTRDITLTPKLTASFNVSATTLCANTLMLTANMSTNATIYNWNFGDGINSNDLAPTHNYTNAGNYYVSLTVINQQGCSSSLSKLITVVSKPTSSFIIGNYNPCGNNKTISFTNTSNNATNYLWLFGDGATSTNLSPVHTYTSSGVFAVKLIAYSANGCSDTATKIVTLLHTASADFTTNQSTQCVLSNQFLFVANNQSQTTYTWNFGDGTVQVGTGIFSVNKVYAAPGNYTVTLTTSYNGGIDSSCKSTKSMVVYVVAKPTAQFTTNGFNTCKGSNTINLTNISTGATNFYWDFGDGYQTIDVSPVKTYSAKGTYIITLIAYNSTGCSDTVKQTVVIADKATAAFTVDHNTQCITNNIFTFTNHSSNLIKNVWVFGDGTSTTDFNPIKSYAAAGTYIVKLITTSALGCSDTATTTISVDAIPTINFAINKKEQCVTNNLFVFTNTYVQPGVSYLWNFSDGYTAIGYSYSKVYTTPGISRVSLIATSANGGCVDSVVQQVIVYSKPVANFVAPTVQQCVNNTIQFINSTTDTALSYLWKFSDGSTQSTTNAIKQYITAGSYNVRLVAVNVGDCRDSITKKVIIVDPPIASFVDTVLNACTGAFKFYSTSTGSILNYFWDFGDTTTSTEAMPSKTFAQTGTYKVKLIVYTASGCSDTTVRLITVHPKSVATYSQSATASCLQGNQFFFKSNSSAGSGAINILWNFGDGSTSTSPSFIKSYNASGIYNVKLLVTSLLSGCKDSITSSVTVYNATSVKIVGGANICRGTNVLLPMTFTGTPPFSVTYTDGTRDSVISNIYSYSYTLNLVPSITTTYRIKAFVDAYCRATDSVLSASSAVVVVRTLTYTQQPEGLATCIGKRVVLYGAAVGDTAFTYQWLKNGLPIAGANKDSLVFSSVTAVDDAYYTLACIMPCGTFVSNVVKVTVQGLPDAPIVNKTVVYCQNDSAKPLVATGNIIRWYTDTILGTGSYIPPTHNTSIPGTTTYYVTNSNILTCESPRYPVVVTVLQGPTISANVGDSVSLVPNQFATIKVTASANTVDVKWFYNGLYMGLTPGNSIVVDRSKLGKYYAEATTIDGCKARTQTISVKANTGFGSSATGNNLTIYPNPSKSLVNVFFDNPVNTNGTLRVVDVLGQVMQTMPVKFTNKNQLMQINVANLAAGIYTIEILNKYNETIARNQLIKTN